MRIRPPHTVLLPPVPQEHDGRSFDDVLDALRRLRGQGLRDVHLRMPPNNAPDAYTSVLQFAGEQGLRVAVQGNGSAWTEALAAWRSLGVTAAIVDLRSAACPRGARAARVRRLARSAQAAQLPLVLCFSFGPDLPDPTAALTQSVRLAQETHTSLWLHGEGFTGQVSHLLRHALQHTLLATDAPEISLTGVPYTPTPTTIGAPPVRLTANLLHALAQGHVPDATSAGVLGQELGLDDRTARQLAARGVPVIDASEHVGGDQPDPRPSPYWDARPLAPDARVAVVCPPLPDQLLAISTLPGLVHALHTRGVHADLLTIYDVDLHASGLCPPRHFSVLQRIYWFWHRSITRKPDPITDYRPPPGRLAHPLRKQDPHDRAQAVHEAFWQTLDLSTYDLIVVPGFDHGRRLLKHPTLRPGTRVQIADWHLMHGARTWALDAGPAHTPLAERRWWPGPHVGVASCFPRFAQLYASVGIPLTAMSWLPYPLRGQHLPLGPAVHHGTHIFSGGAHLRDHATLTAAAALLPHDSPPLHVYADPDDALREVGPLVLKGRAALPDFYEALRAARFVVVPVVHDTTHAAGLTVVAMALAAGRPVVATRTPATVDHLRDGIDSLLVPPHDPQALAAAIQRLHDDPALLARLADGASAARTLVDVGTWAQRLHEGFGTRRTRFAPGCSNGTRYTW